MNKGGIRRRVTRSIAIGGTTVAMLLAHSAAASALTVASWGGTPGGYVNDFVDSRYQVGCGYSRTITQPATAVGASAAGTYEWATRYTSLYRWSPSLGRWVLILTGTDSRAVATGAPATIAPHSFQANAGGYYAISFKLVWTDTVSGAQLGWKSFSLNQSTDYGGPFHGSGNWCYYAG